MYICICNPFTDHDVQAHLNGLGMQKASVKDVYSACSGADRMNCGSCGPELRGMVETHNNTLNINSLSAQMGKALKKSKENV